MQIALTKKLADALKLKPSVIDEASNSLFSWTANWIKVWDNRKTEDMLVLVNHLTRFTIAIYQVKQKDLKNIEEMVMTAISKTLLSMNMNPELVGAYIRMAGDLEFVMNSSRQTAAWVTKAGLECAVRVGHEYNGVSKMYCDTLGALSNYRIVNSAGKASDGFYPYKAMADALTELTGLQAYKCRAFELRVSLDLEVYKAERRIIVPADMKFTQFHEILQHVFGWKNYHRYDFAIADEKNEITATRLVMETEDLEFDKSAILIDGHTLSEFLPEHKRIIYTYDMGDNWEHIIHLVRVVEEYDGELPYLLEAYGQTPPEDVGGVGGFINFREIMLNPKHPKHTEMEEWLRHWTPELREWERMPKVIHI